ncbi:MAG: glycosyltransferase family 4 protein [Candidatus Methylacidiphilales bacterium]|nr:glycosyltransferase family 4 protein [Candidatus Methylacidiphilales bacterium]
MTSGIERIAFIGDYMPRKCGIATFTHDIRDAIAKQFPLSESFIVPVNDLPEGYEYPPEVRFEFLESDLDSYRRAAEYLNFSHVDVVCLQHEFGIYGGPSGSFILPLLRELSVPVVTTLHTILQKPSVDQRLVMRELTALSARLVVMSEKGRSMLREIYNVPDDKIDVIQHGIPDMPFVDPNFDKDQFGVEGKHVLLTFGLLSPNKGIEVVLKTLPKIVQEFPDLVYIILGATHPNLVRQHGEAYRLSLERMAQDLGVERHVSFYNRFVDLDELKTFLGVADIYITPYLHEAQITSGTLAYAVGCGKAVVSTPYWHAEELLAEERGILVPFGDSEALGNEVIGLLRDEQRRHAMRKRAYMYGRSTIWSHTAELYMESFRKARHTARTYPKRTKVRTLEEEPLELPRMQLGHLMEMSDSTGMLQHATYSFRNYREGYCTDDNARALILCVLLEELELDAPELQRLMKSYTAFLNYAFDPNLKRFRNFMGYDRQWLEDVGSTDSQARAFWCLGTCVGRSSHRDLQFWAAHLFEQALPNLLEATAPRSWAFTLLGIYEYFRRFSGDRFVAHARDILTQRLIDLYEKNSTEDWPWFEENVTYANARIPQVLILGGRWAENPRAYEIGLHTLRWLLSIQTSEDGHFRPIGSNGFYVKGEARAQFDQQPIEAHGTVSACLEAYRTTNDSFWYDKARMAFEWFLGRNDLGLSLYDSATGGCCDGLHVDRVNLNQGAESTLAFLIAQAEMLLLENDLKAFNKPREREIQPFEANPSTK